MRKRLTLIVIFAALLILVSATIVIINQSYQLIALADRFHPVAGDVAFWSIAVVFALALGVPVFVLLTLPPPLTPPDVLEGKEYEKYTEQLRKRLARNPHIIGTTGGDSADVEAALAQLDAVAEKRTKAVAAQVFITTAISQNGSLDALLVLAAQSKLVLEIARVYYQRPTIRDLLYLYSNVAATAFIAAELDDLDISEQVQPIVTAVLGSGVAAIPGVSVAATLFVTSVTTGAGNAYLTLRVGIIARQYCRSPVHLERRSIRRSAAMQATRLLGGIAKEGTAAVAAAVFAKPKKYFFDLISNAGARMTAMSDAAAAKSTAAWNTIARRGRTIQEDPGDVDPT